MVLGLLLSSLVTWQMSSKKRKGFFIPCTAAAITLITNYLYYTLASKPPSIVISLQDKEQRALWYAQYRYMQVVYHGGLLLGVVAAYFFSSSLCS